MKKIPKGHMDAFGQPPCYMTRRTSLSLLFGGLAAAVVGPAKAADYPTRFITLIIPFAPGGPTDVMARVVATPWSDALGRSVVIENRPGAGGNIGMGAVARSAPDGYTLLLTSSAYVANPSLYKTVPYDPFRSFEPVSNLGSTPNVIVAAPSSGIQSIAELVKRAKAEPGRLSYASPGAGTTAHLTMELFLKQAGIELIHVPYSGAGPAIQGILGNQVQIGCAAVPPVLAHIKAGKMIGLGSTGTKRWPDLPGVPTLIEAGFPDVVTENFQALFAPAGTPKPILAKLSQTLTIVLAQVDVKEKLAKAGFGVLASTPAELQAVVVREVALWGGVIKGAGISLE